MFSFINNKINNRVYQVSCNPYLIINLLNKSIYGIETKCSNIRQEPLTFTFELLTQYLTEVVTY